VATLQGVHKEETAAASEELLFSRIPDGTGTIRALTFPKLQKSARSSLDWLRDERGDRA
jgi:hypothetical protein